jgi:hypothetical protein
MTEDLLHIAPRRSPAASEHLDQRPEKALATEEEPLATAEASDEASETDQI